MVSVSASRNNARRTRPKGYITGYNPRADTIALLHDVGTVLNEYRAQWPPTARQIYYRLIGAHGYPKTDLFYERLCNHLSNARRGKVIPFDASRDDGVAVMDAGHFASSDHFYRYVRGLGENLERDKLARQQVYLEVWCEAADMQPQLVEVAHQYSVRVYSCSGFDSTTTKKDIADRVCRQGKRAVILHFGDFDSSGVSSLRPLPKTWRRSWRLTNGTGTYQSSSAAWRSLPARSRSTTCQQRRQKRLTPERNVGKARRVSLKRCHLTRSQSCWSVRLSGNSIQLSLSTTSQRKRTSAGRSPATCWRRRKGTSHAPRTERRSRRRPCGRDRRPLWRSRSCCRCRAGDGGEGVLAMPSKASKPAKAVEHRPGVTTPEPRLPVASSTEPSLVALAPEPTIAMLMDLVEMVEDLAAGQVRILEELAALRHRRKK